MHRPIAFPLFEGGYSAVAWRDIARIPAVLGNTTGNHWHWDSWEYIGVVAWNMLEF